MNNKLRKILSVLLEENDWMTCELLSIRSGISKRAVRDALSQFTSEYSGVILSGKKGYCVCKPEQLERLLGKQESESEYHLLSNMIIVWLLLKDCYQKIDDLSETFYVSVSSVNRALRSVKDDLFKYNLSIASGSKDGIRIEGKELNKRIAFIHFWCLLPESIREKMSETDRSRKEWIEISAFVEEILTHSKLELTYEGIRNLSIHLSYMLYRIRNGCMVEWIDVEEFWSDEEANVAREIADKLEKSFGIEIPESEIVYICIHLVSKRENSGKVQGLSVSKETEEVIFKINERIKKVLGLDLGKDFELYTLLAMHVEPMLSRAKFGLRLPNPMIDEMRVKYPAAYECAVVARECIYENLGLTISEEELGYLSIHFGLAIYRLKEQVKLRVLIVCGSGLSTALMLKNKVKRQFRLEEQDIRLCSLNALKTEDLNDVDYIISTVPIPFPVHKQVVYLENVLSDIPAKRQDETHTLAQYIREDLIFLNREAKDFRDVISQLCESIGKIVALPKDFKDQVLYRERMAPTDIGNLTAIPHPFEICTEQSFIAVYILKRSIRWNRNKVKYVFLASYARRDILFNNQINEALIARIMAPEWVASLGKAANKEEVMTLLKGEI